VDAASEPATQEPLPPNALEGVTIIVWKSDRNAIAAAESLGELGAKVRTRPANQKAVDAAEPNTVGIVTRGKMGNRVCALSDYRKQQALGAQHTVCVRVNAFLHQNGNAQLRRDLLARRVRDTQTP